jgi:excisionase family DNA binding protein
MNTTFPIADTATFLTPPEAGKIVRVSEEKIVVWIRAGKLPAANVSEGRVPRFRIHKDDLAAFLRSREAVPEQDGTRPAKGQ